MPTFRVIVGEIFGVDSWQKVKQKICLVVKETTLIVKVQETDVSNDDVKIAL